MFHKLLFLLCLFITTNAIAQHAGITPVKTTEKHDDPQIDYKQVGSPMPPLRVILYHDTTQQQKVSELKGNDTLSKHRNHNKKKKKLHDEINDFGHKQFI